MGITLLRAVVPKPLARVDHEPRGHEEKKFGNHWPRVSGSKVSTRYIYKVPV